MPADPDAFEYDVFLSHSSTDKDTVRDIAERLRADGVRVWFDEWCIRPGDSIPSKIEEGLERSRVLVLCMSENAFASDWATLESQTFRFRDPLNRDLRFLPLRLDDTDPPGSLAQFLYIDWRQDREESYSRLLEACRVGEQNAPIPTHTLSHTGALILEGHQAGVESVAMSPDGRQLLSGSNDETLRIWDVETGQVLRTLLGHTGGVWGVAWSPDGSRVLSGSEDQTVRVWDPETGRSLMTLQGHNGGVGCVAWGPDGRQILSGSFDTTIQVWDAESGQALGTLKGHVGGVLDVAWSPDSSMILSGANDGAVWVWNAQTRQTHQEYTRHQRSVWGVAWSPDGQWVLSGSSDRTVRVWQPELGWNIRTLEGHTDSVNCVAWSPDGRRILSGSDDRTLRVWDAGTGRVLQTLEGHSDSVVGVAWSSDGRRILSGSDDKTIRVWEVNEFVEEVASLESISEQSEYTNAKVLLVGESGAGKTGLSMRLASDTWEASDSTVGAWATQWKLPVPPEGGVEREIWLWDFGGQADQRLIHQLYMDETALAVLVYDGQKADLFETLGTWDRDLGRAAKHEAFQKLLVAGRIDAGGLRVSRERVETFADERGFAGVHETSAKSGAGCEDLKAAILDAIDWDHIAARTSPVLFRRLKDEIVTLKDAGRVLLRFNELRETLAVRLTGEDTRFSDAELSTVITLLSGPGVVWELGFGAWVLLQPEAINAYAQAVIQTMREDDFERGCLPERRVLDGDLTFPASMKRLGEDDERTVLFAMHRILLERGLCLREETESGPLLVFPSYYRRERPDLVDYPSVLVSYRFTGFLDDVYATLVVRLHHTAPFDQDDLWRYAADFKTLGTEKQLGVRMTRRGEGAGEIEVYFDPSISIEQKIIFGKYVHEHLRRTARDVERFRHYVCPHCGTSVQSREVAMQKLEEGGVDATILCVSCEKRVPLWDEMEELFASDAMRQKVRELQEQVQTELDNESKERALVGDVISTVSLAGQIAREMTVADHGIDMEIEFKNADGEATGQKLYLQLKSGDSHLRHRKTDDVEVFDVKPRHVEYWMAHAYPVMLVVRNSEGEVRWVEVRDWLKRETKNGKKEVRQIVFDGERLDVMSVRRWRDRVLGDA